MYTTRPAEFTYHRPKTIQEAAELLTELENARPLAGGHSLIPAMKIRFSIPSALVDIGRIPELGGIEADDGGVRIGATATHAQIASSELVRSSCQALAEAASIIGDRQVRNRGTIGGSLAHADPGADEPTVVTATRSAGLICSSTNVLAESIARCTSSGCIELRSKTSAISRRPASDCGEKSAGAGVADAGRVS